MFTGIIEHAARITRAEEKEGALALALDLGPCADGVALGDSIAVRGCCLTVEHLDGAVATFHLMGQTLSHSAFGDAAVGQTINIERSLRLGDRLGGHIVTGHLDGVGRVARVEDRPGQWDLTIELPETVADLVIPKGSITIDGVSLTVAHLSGREVTVCIIPHTLEVTTLGSLQPGDPVNLEMDSIGKWVRRLFPGADS